MIIKEINETWYTLTTWDGKTTETDKQEEAKSVLREGGEVIKNTRKLFSSGKSGIRLYVSTEITKVKDL